MTYAIETLLANSKQSCLKQGLQLTSKREQVLNILFMQVRCLSAYDLIDLYQSYYQCKISAVSIYRILDFLVSAGLAHKLQSNNQYIACAHIACAHQHQEPQFLICDDCGQVEELGISQQLNKEIKKNTRQSEFQLKSSQLELHGVCHQCQ